jgi:CheY-like chemotaxis protein
LYDGPLLSILIVDDCPLSRKMLRKILSSVGHTCEEAADGSIAVEMMKSLLTSDSTEKKFDCILMDFTMPVKNGPTATKEIRELGYTSPIFGVTGNTNPTDVGIFTTAGANKVFPKPFKLEDFHDAMQHKQTAATGTDAVAPGAAAVPASAEEPSIAMAVAAAAAAVTAAFVRDASPV